jgi:hypothetical protein
MVIAGSGAPLGAAITSIVSLCSYKQMRWVTAWGVVARMEHIHASGDLGNTKCVCHAMGAFIRSA